MTLEPNDRSAVAEPLMATVKLDALCILIEHAQRGGVYMGTSLWDAIQAMPPGVITRLQERANAKTERLLAGAQADVAHREGKPHDESICVSCAIRKAEESRG